MKKVKYNFNVGDLFMVPLSDGTFTLGQVLYLSKEVMNSVICAFTNKKVVNRDEEVQSIDVDSIISVLFTTSDLLKSGDWQVIANDKPPELKQFININELEESGYVGVKVIGSGIIMKFMNACFGLYPWNGFYKVDYLDKLLLSPDKKPSQVIYEKKALKP